MIKHGWFERTPQAIDREYLAKEKTNKYSRSLATLIEQPLFLLS
ncbi:hypothetical protein [Bacillus sp. V2I10]|nr:hypothetical protein [Bacillus sp. V2I10]MDQ0857688.1 hypothetical protein [Bacillus sp. V2I10]